MGYGLGLAGSAAVDELHEQIRQKLLMDEQARRMLETEYERDYRDRSLAEQSRYREAQLENNRILREGQAEERAARIENTQSIIANRERQVAERRAQIENYRALANDPAQPAHVRQRATLLAQGLEREVADFLTEQPEETPEQASARRIREHQTNRRFDVNNPMPTREAKKAPALPGDVAVLVDNIVAQQPITARGRIEAYEDAKAMMKDIRRKHPDLDSREVFKAIDAAFGAITKTEDDPLLEDAATQAHGGMTPTRAVPSPTPTTATERQIRR